MADVFNPEIAREFLVRRYALEPTEVHVKRAVAAVERVYPGAKFGAHIWDKSLLIDELDREFGGSAEEADAKALLEKLGWPSREEIFGMEVPVGEEKG